MTPSWKRLTAEIEGPVSYLDFGGDGMPLLLVHGLGGSSENWLAAAPLLARDARVLAIDLRGHGRTPLGEGQTASVQENRALVERFIEEVFRTPVTLVGNSMGGMISLLHASARPDQVDALVLVDPSVPFPEGVESDPVITSLFATYMTPGTGEDFVRQGYSALPPEVMVDQTLQLCCVDASRVDPSQRQALVELATERTQMPWSVDGFLQAARSLVELNLNSDEYYATIRSVKVPALIVQGEFDRLIPLAATRALAELKPEWRLEVFDGVGHTPQLEVPDRFASSVLNWLREEQKLQEVSV